MTIKSNVLFVDDEMNMLSMIKRNFFHYSKYNLFLADSAKKALEIIKENEIKVIITDLQMPEINGIELVEIIEKNYPNIVKIILTGNNQVPNILATINNASIFRFIVKPINFQEELIPALEEACKLYNMNTLKEKLMQEKYSSEESSKDIPTDLIVSLSETSLSYIDIVYTILKKAPYMNKEMLEKLSLDSLSRLEVVKTNIQTIEKLVARK